MPKSNTPHNRRRDADVSGDAAVKAVIQPNQPEPFLSRGILQGQCQDLNQREKLYRSLTLMSTVKLEKVTSAELRLEIGSKIKKLRESLGLSQKDFGAQVEASRGSVARWEIGADMPRPRNLANIAKLASQENRGYWLEKAGLPTHEDGAQSMEKEAKIVPLFKGKIAAGHGTEIAGEIEEELTLPRSWFPPGSRIVALKVEGDSMAPLVNEGYMVLVDVSVRDLKHLVGHMVAARSDVGCTLKWLRRSADTGNLQLIPQHVSEDYPIRTITPENEHEFRIVGRVVHWIGTPKPPKKRQRM